MTPRRPHDGPFLTAAELAAVSQALASCSHLLAWCGAHAGPGYHQAVPASTRAAGRERTAAQLYYEVSTAADRLGAVLPEGGLR